MAAALATYPRVTHKEVVIKITGVDTNTHTIDLSALPLPQGVIVQGPGTIITSTGGVGVTGVGTTFTANMVGGKLYNPADGTELGTIATYNSATSVDLAANATATINPTGAYGISYASQKLHATNPQEVPIAGVLITGDGAATLTRNGKITMRPNAAAANGFINFTGGADGMPPDRQEERSDILVTIVGGTTTELWLKLRKVGGWESTLEPERFSIYDDETAVGS